MPIARTIRLMRALTLLAPVLAFAPELAAQTPPPGHRDGGTRQPRCGTPHTGDVCSQRGPHHCPEHGSTIVCECTRQPDGHSMWFCPHGGGPLMPPDLAAQMDALVRSLAARADSSVDLGTNTDPTFTVKINGVAILVSVWRTALPSEQCVRLSAPYPAEVSAAPYRGRAAEAVAAMRPMHIELRPESNRDRTDKRAGVVAEIQTGDPEFDAKVFIDTLTPGDVAKRVIGDGARSAALRLMGLPGARVVIDLHRNRPETHDNVLEKFPDRSVALYLRGDVPEEVAHGDPGGFVLNALADLVTALPPVTTLEGAPEINGARIGVAALWIVAVFAVLAMMLACLVHKENARAMRAALIGVLIGGSAGWVIARLAIQRMRGRSDSGAQRRLATKIIVVISACVVGAVSAFAFS